MGICQTRNRRNSAENLNPDEMKLDDLISKGIEYAQKASVAKRDAMRLKYLHLSRDLLFSALARCLNRDLEAQQETPARDRERDGRRLTERDGAVPSEEERYQTTSSIRLHLGAVLIKLGEAPAVVHALMSEDDLLGNRNQRHNAPQQPQQQQDQEAGGQERRGHDSMANGTGVDNRNGTDTRGDRSEGGGLRSPSLFRSAADDVSWQSQSLPFDRAGTPAESAGGNQNSQSHNPSLPPVTQQQQGGNQTRHLYLQPRGLGARGSGPRHAPGGDGGDPSSPLPVHLRLQAVNAAAVPQGPQAAPVPVGSSYVIASPPSMWPQQQPTTQQQGSPKGPTRAAANGQGPSGPPLVLGHLSPQMDAQGGHRGGHEGSPRQGPSRASLQQHTNGIAPLPAIALPLPSRQHSRESNVHSGGTPMHPREGTAPDVPPPLEQRPSGDGTTGVLIAGPREAVRLRRRSDVKKEREGGEDKERRHSVHGGGNTGGGGTRQMGTQRAAVPGMYGAFVPPPRETLATGGVEAKGHSQDSGEGRSSGGGEGHENDAGRGQLEGGGIDGQGEEASRGSPTSSGSAGRVEEGGGDRRHFGVGTATAAGRKAVERRHSGGTATTHGGRGGGNSPKMSPPAQSHVRRRSLPTASAMGGGPGNSGTGTSVPRPLLPPPGRGSHSPSRSRRTPSQQQQANRGGVGGQQTRPLPLYSGTGTAGGGAVAGRKLYSSAVEKNVGGGRGQPEEKGSRSVAVKEKSRKRDEERDEEEEEEEVEEGSVSESGSGASGEGGLESEQPNDLQAEMMRVNVGGTAGAVTAGGGGGTLNVQDILRKLEAGRTKKGKRQGGGDGSVLSASVSGLAASGASDLRSTSRERDVDPVIGGSVVEPLDGSDEDEDEEEEEEEERKSTASRVPRNEAASLPLPFAMPFFTSQPQAEPLTRPQQNLVPFPQLHPHQQNQHQAQPPPQTQTQRPPHGPPAGASPATPSAVHITGLPLPMIQHPAGPGRQNSGSSLPAPIGPPLPLIVPHPPPHHLPPLAHRLSVSIEIRHCVSLDIVSSFRVSLPAPASHGEEALAILDRRCRQMSGFPLQALCWITPDGVRKRAAAPDTLFLALEHSATAALQGQGQALERGGDSDEDGGEETDGHRGGPPPLRTRLILLTAPVRPPSDLQAVPGLLILSVKPERVRCGPGPPPRLEVRTHKGLPGSHSYSVGLTNQWDNGKVFATAAKLLSDRRGVECVIPGAMVRADDSNAGLYDVHLIVDGKFRSDNRRALSVLQGGEGSPSASSDDHSLGSFEALPSATASAAATSPPHAPAHPPPAIAVAGPPPTAGAAVGPDIAAPG
uniref:Uncharacterized protein n=1 Tax=Chromera velia CCMP2878 TaxID=1169474 RepID=A0A0G4G347_9ALVE|eukprot:Cvel_20038.t1-p1 / transcript=Cvel_20038.t1 / gene=Cvel_20038 / organism=Chromera_velia_CCMP2878 / gene_product=hypothetical protein / transcript_product=hypothetical protein / location=Cvel_scaffold1770:27082-33237(+) / protein_length=1326 / sequence_SO=supercontig / SO=protein_coding / is_pseudo=false